MEAEPVVGRERVLRGHDEQSHLSALLVSALGRPPADVAPDELLALAQRNDLPLAAVAALAGTETDPAWELALAAEAEAAATRAATVALVAEALGDLAPYVAHCASPVRPYGGNDVDLHVPPWMLGAAASRLTEAGLVPLPRWDEPGARTLVLVAGGRVVDRVDLAAGPSSDVVPGAPLGRLTAEAAARRTRTRIDERGVVRLADQWDLATYGAEPATEPRGGARRRVRAMAAKVPRPERKPRTYRVAFSGIDGSGKTTQVRALAASLEAAGVTVTTIWNRPGFQLRLLDAIARPVKRVLRHDTRPTLDRQLAGEAGADAAASRTGVVGWFWLLLVCVTSLSRSWRGALRGARRGGVVIFERHLLDSLVDVEWQFAGVRRGFHRWLLKTATPRPDLSVRMVIDPDVAFARNPYDIFKHEHIRQHAAIADRLAEGLGPFLTLDSGEPLPGLLAVALDSVLSGYAGRPGTDDARAGAWRVLLPADARPVALVDLPPYVADPLRAAYGETVTLARDLGDVRGPGAVWDGVHIPLKPGVAALVVADRRTPGAVPDAPATALLVPSSRRHDVAVYPSPERPERFFARGWPAAAAGSWLRRARQRSASTPLWRLQGRSGLRLEGIAPSLADDVLADVARETGHAVRLRGVHAGNGQVLLRARHDGGDYAVRVATSPGGEQRLDAQANALATVVDEVRALRGRVPAVAGDGTVAGHRWVAEEWSPGATGPGGRYWHAAGGGWAEARALAATLASRPTGATGAGWSRRWAATLADLGPEVVDAVESALAPLDGLTPTAWCHGDLWPGNLVIDRRRTVAIDWDHARRDAPAAVDAVYAEVWRRALDTGAHFGAAAADLVADGAPGLEGVVVAGSEWSRLEPEERRALVVAAFVLHTADRPKDRLGAEWEAANVAPFVQSLSRPLPPQVPRVEETGTLESRAARGTLWLALGAFVTKGMQTASLLVLAALLAPAELGLLSVGALVFNVLLVIQDLGVADVLSLRRDRVTETARTALTLMIVGATALTVVAWFAAPALARFFNAPDGVYVIRGLTVMLPGYAAATVPMALMQRHLDFKRRLVPDAVPALAGGVLTIGLAFAGYGVGSLVAGQILQGMLVPACAWLVGTRVRPGWDWRIAREIVGYGRHTTSAGVLQLTLLNVDYAIVARVLGEVALGFYSLAFRICYLTYVNVAYVINGAAFHYYNRLHSKDEVGAAISRVTSAVVVVVTPLSVGLLLFSGDVVLLGERWAPSAVAIRGLALYAFAISLSQTAQVALKAVGRPDQYFACRLLHLVGLTAALLLVTRQGIGAVAVTQFVVAAAIAALSWTFLFRAVAVGTRALLGGIGTAAAGAAAMAVTVWALRTVLGFGGQASWEQLLVVAPSALVVYAVVVRLVAGRHFAQTVRAVRGRA